MTVLVTTKIFGDTDLFIKSIQERADELAAVSERGRQQGAVHHRFGIGDGYVVAVDEWSDSDAFAQFFGDPAMREFMESVGADLSRDPEVTVATAIESADQF